MRSHTFLTRRAFSNPAQSGQKPAHVKRFYKQVDVVEHPLSAELPKLAPDEKVSFTNIQKAHHTYYAVTLDGRVTKTLFQDVLAIPSRALAVAIAEEWDSQGETVDMKTLKLN